MTSGSTLLNVNSRSSGHDRAAAAWQRAARARERAERERVLAQRYAREAGRVGDDMGRRLEYLHRTTAARHQVAAEILESFARRAETWVRRGDAGPEFMATVAEACGTSSAGLTLVDADCNQLAIASSGEPASSALELEFVLGEGPAREAASRRRLVVAKGAVLAERWPGYGPALIDLGIREVAAVPLEVPGDCVGALTVFDPQASVRGSALLRRVADALARTVLLGADALPGLVEDADIQPKVHQASGMVAVQMACSVADALELIKARSFAEGRLIGDVAGDIVSGQLKLGREVEP